MGQFIEWMIKIFEKLFQNPKSIILILICIIISGGIGGSFFVKALQEHVKSLEKVLQERKSIDDIEKKFNVVKDIELESVAKLEEKQKEVKSLKSNIDSLNNLVADKENELNKLKNDLAELQKRGSKDSVRINNLKRLIDEKENDLKQHKENVSQLENELKEKSKKFNEEINQLQRKLASFDKNNERLKHKIDSLISNTNKDLKKEEKEDDGNKELLNELNKLKTELEELKMKGSQDRTKIESLELKIIDKDRAINDYQKQISDLENQVKELENLIKTSKKDTAISERNPEKEKIVIPTGTFRSTAKELSEQEVKEMLKKFDFFCEEYSWTKDFCNPKGHGFNNKFEVKTITGEKIVIDHASGLMWQQSGSDNYMSFENSKKYIEEINKQGYAGFRDWRLPTLEEAMTLVEPEKSGDLYIDAVFDRKQWWIWTCDLLKGAAARWVVYFLGGTCDLTALTNLRHVRAVRSGQLSSG